VDGLLGAFEPRRPDARDFALRYRVLLLQASNRVPLDVSLGAMPFEERAVERASPFAVGAGESLLTCSAEDRDPPQGTAGARSQLIDGA
jgi:hypothetical protein